MKIPNWISSCYHTVQKRLNEVTDASDWPVKDCKVVFEAAQGDEPPRSMSRCSIKWLLRCSWDRLTQLVNTACLFYHGFNIHKIQSAVASHDSLLARAKFSLSGIPTFLFATHPSTTAAILKPHRDAGPFIIDNGPGSIFALISEMLNDKNLTPDDIIFTCSEEKTKFFHLHLKNEFSSKAIGNYKPQMLSVVNRELESWLGNKKINVTEASHHLVCDAMSTVLLGCPDDDRHLAFAMQTFFDYIVAKFSKKDFDEQKLITAKNYFWERVLQGIDNKDSFAGRLSRNPELDHEQVKMIIFSLLFAGTDSSSMSLTYGIYKCAQDDVLPWKAKSEIAKMKDDISLPCSTPVIVQQIIRESLRMFTPVVGITRVAREDSVQRSSCDNESVIHFIAKKELLAPSQNLAARSPLLFPNNPDKFLPERHEKITSLISLPWLPFGGGNPCTGWMFYNVLAETLFTELLGRYEFSTNIKHEVEQVGSFINKLKEPIYVEDFKSAQK